MDGRDGQPRRVMVASGFRGFTFVDLSDGMSFLLSPQGDRVRGLADGDADGWTQWDITRRHISRPCPEGEQLGVEFLRQLKPKRVRTSAVEAAREAVSQSASALDPELPQL